MTDVPNYWKVLLTPVSPEKGLPHFRNVHISGIKSTGAQRAFSVSSYKDSPLQDFTFEDLDIEAKTAGSIQNAENWKFKNIRIRTADGSTITVKDSQGVTGLPEGK
jgi:hypothetical protein